MSEEMPGARTPTGETAGKFVAPPVAPAVALEKSEPVLLVLAAGSSLRETLTRSLREAGCGTIHSAAAEPAVLSALLDSGTVSRVDLVVVVVPGDEPGAAWGMLRAARGRLGAPAIVIAERRSRAVLERAFSLGASECLAGGEQLDLELLGLKVEKVLLTETSGAALEADQRRTQRLFVNALAVLARIIESKDPYTRFHSHNVAKWARTIGRRCGLGENELDRLGIAAILHDLGKVGVSDSVIDKTTSLSEEESALVRRHPAVAAEILEPLADLADIIPAIRHHHERWDGRGYPELIAGEETPLLARIIGIADAYDTMISERTYKKPYPPEKVREELVRGRGTQFEPRLVDILLSLMDEEQ